MALRSLSLIATLSLALSAVPSTGDSPMFNPRESLVKCGNRSLRKICLTFDDGPSPDATQSILKTLTGFKIKATFFVIGKEMAKYPWLVRAMVGAGNEVGNHTYHHLYLDRLDAEKIDSELNEGQNLFEDITGRKMTLMRPPGMHYNSLVLNEAKKLGYLTVSYNVGAKDFFLPARARQKPDLKDIPPPTPKLVEERVLENAKPGAILLLHENAVTAEALPKILRRLEKEGYTFVSVHEMLKELPTPIDEPENPPDR